MEQAVEADGRGGRLARRGIALVTGGSRGIGRAVVQALALYGFDVAVNYQSNSVMARETCELVAAQGRRAIAVQADVSAETAVVELMATVVAQLGPPAVLVNNAGIAHAVGNDGVTASDWDRVLSVNLKSAFLVTQAVIPHMRAAGWGRIVNLSSIAAQIGGIVGPHYAASKAGLIGLTHFYAAQLASVGITVNAVAPGFIDTDMLHAVPGVTTHLVPVGRLGTTDEVASVVLELINNGYLTGQTINVNGGRHMSS